MEHRTLKPRENVGNGNVSVSKRNPLQNSTHYQNMKNLQQLMQTIDSYPGRDLNLPPPAKILPYSGIKPQVNFFWEINPGTKNCLFSFLSGPAEMMSLKTRDFFVSNF